MKSLWTDTASIAGFEPLKGDLKTDVLIIGGGMAGILCAYFLQEKGVNYALVEGSTIASGITKNTTAKITSQHGLIYHNLVKHAGLEKASMYLRANELAVETYKTLCKDIPCDLEEKDAYVYSRIDEEKITKEIEAVQGLGFHAQFQKQLPLPIQIAGAIKFEHQAQFHPLKFIQGISKGLHIYENTFVKEMAPHTAITDAGKITAKKIIVATHFPFINKHGSYFLKMYQHRSYVLALENGPDVAGMFLDEAQKGMSFRNYNGLLLIGGGDHRTGKDGGKWEELRRFAKKYYPDAEEKYAWATQDCMTLDSIPYIGHYSRHTPDLYVATGFNKWGMTSSMVAAMILTDMVMGKPNEYAPVFSPHRSMLKPQLLVNGAEATANLLTISPKRCPHMGCALKWNRAERTWDCPCHGSRFERDGKLIDNPATGSLKNKK